LVLDILCVTYFLTSVTMPDPQTCDMRHIRWNDVSASCGISSPYKSMYSMCERSFRWRFM